MTVLHVNYQSIYYINCCITVINVILQVTFSRINIILIPLLSLLAVTRG